MQTFYTVVAKFCRMHIFYTLTALYSFPKSNWTNFLVSYFFIETFYNNIRDQDMRTVVKKAPFKNIINISVLVNESQNRHDVCNIITHLLLASWYVLYIRGQNLSCAKRTCTCLWKLYIIYRNRYSRKCLKFQKWNLKCQTTPGLKEKKVVYTQERIGASLM